MTPLPHERPIVVIGGSGFVGREMMRQLKRRGVAAFVVDREPGGTLDHRQADLTDVTALTAALAGCSAAIFLAAEWRDDVHPISRYYSVNVDGARNFVTAARANGILRCVFTSSVSIYGPTRYEVDESFPPAPINDYGRSKLQAEAVLRAWAESDPGVALTIVRPTVIFGPGNRGNVWNLLNQIANGPFLMLGDGTNRKSIAYVENVAGFLLACLDAGPGVHTFNYADKPDFDMNALVRLVRSRMGRGAMPARVPYPLAMLGGRVFDFASRLVARPIGITSERVFKFCANTQYSADAAWATGYRPPVPLLDGLTWTIDAEFARS